MATINTLASRLTGVAPLSVFFDTIGTAGVTQPPLVGGRREYADFEYTWMFDDVGAGTWAKSGKTKEMAYGYVASHVFETAGTYDVTVYITDGDTVAEYHNVIITVTDPDTVYSGTNTVCMSSSGVFTGCPAGATQVTTTVFSDILTHLGTNKRVLYRRGDSWNEAGTIGLGGIGMTIGAYGTGTSPDERGIFANAPLINASGIQNKLFDVDGTSDVRIMDLDVANTGTCNDGFEGSTNISELLLLRNKIHDFDAYDINISHWNTAGNDNNLVSLVDNDISEGGGIMIYIGSERLTIMGNQCRDAPTSHTLRVWQSYKGVIQHNESSGASYSNSAGRSALKFHGPSAAQLIDAGNGGLDNPTRWTIVSDNLFGQCPPTPVSIGPQNAQSDEYLEDILVENNRFYSEYGTGSPLSVPLRVHLEMHCSYSTARNNVFFGDLSANSYDGITVSQRGVEPAPTGTRVYNNTIYKSETGTDAIGVNITASATNTIAINNLVHFNAAITNRAAVVDNGITSTVSNNLLTDASLLVDPENAVYLDKDFRQTASSPSIDGGTMVPVFRDFDDSARTVTIIDQGAFEYGSAGSAENRSLTVAGVWEPGVWAETVWAPGVWSEEVYAPPGMRGALAGKGGLAGHGGIAGIGGGIAG